MFTFALTQHGVLDASREVGKHKLTLRVRNMRLNRDGFARGLVAMIVDTTPICSTIVDIDDASERHSFANDLYGTRARKGLFGADITGEYPLEVFEQEFMLWARTAWNAYIGATAGGYVEGDAAPSAPRWAVPGLILDGATNIWAGDAKAGKSTLARLACQSLNHGVGHIIPIREQAGAIWVNAEEPPEEHSRQFGNVNDALGLTRTKPVYTVDARGMSIADLSPRLEKAVREVNPKHIFVDSLSRMAQGMSLNDNNTATMLVDAVSGLGCSVIWIGHTGWENRNRLAGSRHFENAARLLLLVQSRISMGGVSPELTRGIRTRVTNANGAISTEPMHWTLNYHREHGLVVVEQSDSYTWPTLSCDAFAGEAKCGRRTWDGVMRNGTIRCTRHRDEDDEG